MSATAPVLSPLKDAASDAEATVRSQPLGNTTNSVSGQGSTDEEAIKPQWFDDRDEALVDRTLNHFLFQATKNEQGDWVDGERWANCGRLRVSRSPDAMVQAKISEQGVGHLSGYQMCGSIWACPQCGAKIRRHRGHQIECALRKWLEMGGRCFIITPTMWHHKGMPLTETFNAVMGAWRSAFQGRAKELLVEMGYAGFVKAFDLTIGAHGWHPHIHAVIFIHSQETKNAELEERYEEELRKWHYDIENWERALLSFMSDGSDAPGEYPKEPLRPAPVSMAEIEATGDVELGVNLDQYFRSQWNGWLTRNGHPEIAQAGLMVDPIKDDAGIGQYVSKASFELARSDKKKGRHGGLNQWELLREARSNGEVDQIAKWEEYCRVTKGRRCIEWSRNGLKQRLVGVDDDDPNDSDEEIAKREVEAESVAQLGPNLARLCGMQVRVKIGVLRAIERNRADGLRHYLEYVLKKRVLVEEIEVEAVDINMPNAPPAGHLLIEIVD